MANPELVELLKQGSEGWNRWREQHPEILHVNLINANLIGMDLSDANLIGADLSDADLSLSNLRGVLLCGGKLVDAILHGTQLVAADLSGADLSNANLNYANLRDVDMSNAILSDADLGRADLRSADLRGADLVNANLSEVNLSNAMLNGAILNRADLGEANLSNADLQGAIIWNTVFAQMDLREVKGLAEIDHQGPSHIELYSVQLPQDGSALHFLRGAGVPDEWIDFYRAQMMHPIHYHSCFISYSSKDETLARRLHADLQAHGVRCWFAPEDMKIGEKIRSRIDEAIHLQDKLLLILSEHALASGWVEVEVEAALEKEQRQDRDVLFPVMLDESVLRTNYAWAKQLRRSRHIGDFTHWSDPQTYQQAFERLLRDLKAESKEGNNG